MFCCAKKLLPTYNFVHNNITLAAFLPELYTSSVGAVVWGLFTSYVDMYFKLLVDLCK